MRWFFLVLSIVVVAVVYALGPRGEKFSNPPFELFPDMDRQYKLKPQKESMFFENHQGARKPVAGTVPLGYVKPIEAEGLLTTASDYSAGDGYASTGQFGDFYGKGFPTGYAVNDTFLQRGKERYAISCKPCHGESGNGVGVISKYWAIPPTANLLDPRVAAMPEGQIFWTITHGKGLMGPYGGVIPVADRWAIVAYVRALQAASK